MVTIVFSPGQHRFFNVGVVIGMDLEVGIAIAFARLLQLASVAFHSDKSCHPIVE